MNVLVTGAAGFIGSHLVDRLLDDGHSVIGVDNFSSGFRQFLAKAESHPRFRFHEADLLASGALEGILTSDCEHVFHLAANADVRFGVHHPRRDLEQNVLVTWNMLEAMRKVDVRSLTFVSTGAVYGETRVIPTPEDAPFPVQTSLYAASKLAGEGMVAAYAAGWGLRATILRFVSILGERYSHGHVYDFVRHLLRDPETLPVLGNGKQKKSYLYVGDCVSAMTHLLGVTSAEAVRIFNLGTDEYITVDESIDVICDELSVRPRKIYSGGERGWIGDIPFIFLDCARLKQTGWSARTPIREAVRRTVQYLVREEWIFTARGSVAVEVAS